MNFFRYLWWACSGFKSYRHMLHLPLKKTVGCWMIFTGVLALLAFLQMRYFLSLALPLIEEKGANLPPLSITNGVAYSPLPQPHYSNTNDFPIILDLKNTERELEERFSQGLVIREKTLTFWSGKIRMETPYSKGLPDGTVDREYLRKLGEDQKKALPMLIPAIWLTLSLIGLLQAFIFTALAGIVERNIEPAFKFEQLFNVAIFALIPASVGTLFVMCLVPIYQMLGLVEAGVSGNTLLLIYFAIYSFFIVFASGACRPTLQPPREKPSGSEEE
jgi:hypothetical protein